MGRPRHSHAFDPGYRRPVVIVQGNAFNRSRLATTVICTLSSKLERANAPGNVLLTPGEGRLSKQSVVVVSQVYTIDKTQLEEQIGTLSQSRTRQVLNGLQLLLEPDEVD